jgi:phosphate-selective porin
MWPGEPERASEPVFALMYTPYIGLRCWVALALSGLPAFAQQSGTLQSGPGRFSLDEKGITIADEAVTFRIGGRLHVDPATGQARADLNDPFGNHIEVRRAWAESYLTFADSVELAFQYDFNSERRPINDAVVAYRGINPVILTYGNFKEPFSLQQLGSNNDTTFLERALPDALVPGRNKGPLPAGALRPELRCSRPTPSQADRPCSNRFRPFAGQREGCLRADLDIAHR